MNKSNIDLYDIEYNYMYLALILCKKQRIETCITTCQLESSFIVAKVYNDIFCSLYSIRLIALAVFETKVLFCEVLECKHFLIVRPGLFLCTQLVAMIIG